MNMNPPWQMERTGVLGSNKVFEMALIPYPLSQLSPANPVPTRSHCIYFAPIRNGVTDVLLSVVVAVICCCHRSGPHHIDGNRKTQVISVISRTFISLHSNGDHLASHPDFLSKSKYARMDGAGALGESAVDER